MLDGIVYRDRKKLKRVKGPCPPRDATRPTGDVFFRFVKTDPIDVNAEFKPWQDDNPGKKPPDPCTGWAVSVYRPENKARKRLEQLQKRKALNFASSRLCPITLTSEAGAILGPTSRNSRQQGHYNWWPAETFQIADHLG